MAVAIEQGQKGHDGSYARRHSITTSIKKDFKTD